MALEIIVELQEQNGKLILYSFYETIKLNKHKLLQIK